MSRILVLPEQLSLILDLVSSGTMSAFTGYIVLLGGPSGPAALIGPPDPVEELEDEDDYIPPFYDYIWQEWDVKEH